VPGPSDLHRLACGHSQALTVILLGFDDGGAGRMAAHAQRRPAPSLCGAAPGIGASAAAAVRQRGKASGRRAVQRVPRRAEGNSLQVILRLSYGTV
jgi:hypothetical protein